MLRKILTIALVCVSICGCRHDSERKSGAGKLKPFSLGETVEGLRVPVLLQADGRKEVSLKELRGSIVVLEFWATWCGPCIAAIDHLNEVADEFSKKKGFRFISVTDEDAETVIPFLEKRPIHTWIGVDKEGSLLDAFGVRGIPTTIVINSAGKVAAVTAPAGLNEELLQRVQKGEIVQEKSEGSGITAGVDPFAADKTESILQFTLRETATASVQSSTTGSATASTMLGMSPKRLIEHAFDLSSLKTIFEADLPDKKFDLIMQFPKSMETTKQLKRLAIASAFDIQTRQEMRLVDVFVMRTQENGRHNLSPTVSTGGAMATFSSTEINVIKGHPSSTLTTLESKLHCPVIDETSIDGLFDFKVKYEKGASPEEFARVFSDATGLVLTPEKRELEFTIVENASGAQ